VPKTLQVIARDLATKPVRQPKAMQEPGARQEVFDEIKAEADKLGALDGDGPDWDELDKKSQYYLLNVETDLRVVCYLARAWSMQHGLEGLQAGLTLIDALLRNKAGELAPPRIRGRQQALDWWARHSQIQWRADIHANSSTADCEQFAASLKELCGLIDDAKLAGQPELLVRFLAEVDGAPAVTNASADADDSADASITALADESVVGARGNSADAQAKPGTPEETHESDAELEHFLNKIVAPISADNPTGDEEYLSDEFDRIKTQVNEIWRVADVDWDAVVDQCSTFLTTMSKDLRVVAYCVHALMERGEVSGLYRGLAGLQAFLQCFGADCHPARATGRRAALEWLAKSIDGWFQQRRDKTFELTEIKACNALCEAINETLLSNEQIMVGHASLGKAARTLRDQIEATEAGDEPKPPAASVDSPATPPASPPAPPPAPPVPASAALNITPTVGGDIADEEQFRSAMSGGNTYVLKLVRFKRSSDPGSPMSYRLLRTWLWGNLSSTIDTSALQAPIATAMPDWQVLIDADDPMRLLETAEKLFSANRFLLDLNRYTAVALDALGHHEASAAIQDELRQLIRRFPHLPMASFAGDVAIANEATRHWLQSEVLASDLGSPEPPQVLAGGVDSAEEFAQEVVEEARALAESGDRVLAVQIIETHLRQAVCERDRFVCRLRLARFFLDLGEGELALATVEGMEMAIKEFGLERWDPAFALDVARLAFKVASGSESTTGLEHRARALMSSARSRICRLEPAAALEQVARQRTTAKSTP